MPVKDFFFRLYARLFARPVFQKWNELLCHLGLRGLGILNYYDHRISGEKWLIEHIAQNYSPTVFVDVGANEGDYTQIICDKMPQCAAYCFEPIPQNFQKLSQKLQTKNNVKLYQLGVSDKSGNTIIYDYANNQGSQHGSLYKNTFTRFYQEQVVEIPINLITLDEFASQYHIFNIHFLKIDTEGHEFAVLKGAKSLLEKKQIDIIHFEFNDMNVDSSVFMKDFVELLHDFNLYRLLPNGLLPIHYQKALFYEFFAYQNIVAFRKGLSKN